jgi:Uma2 family endonuclease
MSIVPKRWLSPQEYLAQECLAEFRSEYFRGEMFAIAGGSPRHSPIKSGTNREPGNRLKDRLCTVYDSDLRVLVSPTGPYTYPDASVICGELRFDDQFRDTIVNPTVLVEVLSSSTEAHDRGKKFEHYRQIPSLQEYLLISQDSPTLERCMRNADGEWTKTVVTGLDPSLHLPSIGVTLALAEIYDKVNFADEPDATRYRPS